MTTTTPSATLQDIKDQIARSLPFPYKNWDAMEVELRLTNPEQLSKFHDHAAMEIAQLSWEAGKDATISNAHKFSDTYVISGKINEDKETFINNLFREP